MAKPLVEPTVRTRPSGASVVRRVYDRKLRERFGLPSETTDDTLTDRKKGMETAKSARGNGAEGVDGEARQCPGPGWAGKAGMLKSLMDGRLAAVGAALGDANFNHDQEDPETDRADRTG